MKGSELKRLLKKNKCFITNHRSNHDEWFSPKTQNYFFVPRHDSQEVDTGTLKSILKSAGIK